MQKAIIYTGNFLFPDGNAAGKRVWGNAKAIKAAGYEVICFCFRKDDPDSGLQKKICDDMQIYSIPYSRGIHRVNNVYPAILFRRILKEVRKMYTIDSVIMYGTLGTSGYNMAIIRFCQRLGIRLICDKVDLFDEPHKNNLLRYWLKKRDLYVMDHKILPSCDKWIAVSDYLKKRMPDPEKTMIVPPLSVEVKRTMVADTNQPTTIAYASLISEKGIPVSSWKDRVDAIVDVCYVLLHVRNIPDFKMCFIGFTKDQFLGQFPEAHRAEYQDKLRVLENHIVFYGLQSNTNAQKIISQSDFTILLRDSKTCTNAGFPTKVSESLSLGVPVIANATSDIAIYVHDMVNGCIVPDPHDIEGIADKIESLIALTREQKDIMRTNAINDKPFYYEKYVENFKAFLMN
ncbi:MAG: glycosyltransferase [Clostridia bacterium]|nr:glycosyltransferase [Clostridia bacterium]